MAKTILKKIGNVLENWDNWELLAEEFNLDAKEIKKNLKKEAIRRITRMTYGRDNLYEKPRFGFIGKRKNWEN